MSLRLRLIASIAAVLIVSLTAGGLLVFWTARHSVETEMRAALGVGVQTLRSALADLKPGETDVADLKRLVAAFDGDRHLSASLACAGMTPVSSTIAKTGPAVPDWFLAIVGVRPEAASVATPGGSADCAAITLTTDPGNEVQEVWTSCRNSLGVMALFCLLTSLMVYWSLGRALSPLRSLSTALAEIGSGRTDARVEASGPPELATLSEAFNRMAEELGSTQAQNRLLHEQVLTLQEQERAELARDLHDEIGPFLLAVNIDIGQIERAAGPNPALVEPIGAIREAVRHMQRQVRNILGRLRPIGLAEFGLDEAIGTLVEFWRKRHADIVMVADLNVPPGGFGEVLDATLYRVIQEALSNALRHGKPKHIQVRIDYSDGTLTVSVLDDGVGAQNQPSPGFGLTGMRERVAAAGGELVAAPLASGGFCVTARFDKVDEASP